MSLFRYGSPSYYSPPGGGGDSNYGSNYGWNEDDEDDYNEDDYYDYKDQDYNSWGTGLVTKTHFCLLILFTNNGLEPTKATQDGVQQTTAIAETTIAETTTIEDKLYEKQPFWRKLR